MTSKMTGAAVEIDALSKMFKTGVLAVDSVSMSIQPGEFVTLLGPSGSGKTTILNVMAGFTRPSAGRVLLDGIDVVGLPTH